MAQCYAPPPRAEVKQFIPNGRRLSANLRHLMINRPPVDN